VLHAFSISNNDLPTDIAQASLHRGVDMLFSMLENQGRNIKALMEDRRTPRRYPRIPGPDSELGSIDSRTSAPPPSEPDGFAQVLRNAAKALAREVITTDPSNITKIVERRFEYRAQLIKCAQDETTSDAIIKHVRTMDTDKVRNKQNDRVCHLLPRALTRRSPFVAQMHRCFLKACRDVRTDLHVLVKNLLHLRFGYTNPRSLKENKGLLEKILTGRAGFEATTECRAEEAQATALERSSTSLVVLVTVISTISHKALRHKKRSFVDPKETKYAIIALDSYFELFHPYEDTASTSEQKKEKWSQATGHVLAERFAFHSDFGTVPASQMSATPMTGEFVVYVWQSLLHQMGLCTPPEGKRERLESKGDSATRYFCYQMCLRSAFIDLINTHLTTLGLWFDVDPDGETEATGKIIIHKPDGVASEIALRYLRTMRLAGDGCTIKTLNKMNNAETGSGCSILAANFTDELSITHDPWSLDYEGCTPPSSTPLPTGKRKRRSTDGAQAGERASDDDEVDEEDGSQGARAGDQGARAGASAIDEDDGSEYADLV
jgi:hypothetical protein